MTYSYVYIQLLYSGCIPSALTKQERGRVCESERECETKRERVSESSTQEIICTCYWKIKFIGINLATSATATAVVQPDNVDVWNREERQAHKKNKNCRVYVLNRREKKIEPNHRMLFPPNLVGYRFSGCCRQYNGTENISFYRPTIEHKNQCSDSWPILGRWEHQLAAIFAIFIVQYCRRIDFVAGTFHCKFKYNNNPYYKQIQWTLPSYTHTHSPCWCFRWKSKNYFNSTIFYCMFFDNGGLFCCAYKNSYRRYRRNSDASISCKFAITICICIGYSLPDFFICCKLQLNCFCHISHFVSLSVHSKCLCVCLCDSVRARVCVYWTFLCPPKKLSQNPTVRLGWHFR